VDNSGELFYAVLDRPIRWRGADITQVILRPAKPGQVPHYGMRAFGVEIAPVLDPALRTAEVIDPSLLDFVALGEIDDDNPAEPAPPPSRDQNDPEIAVDAPQIPDDRPPPRAVVAPPPRARRRPLWIAAGAAAVLAAGVGVLLAGQSGSGGQSSAPVSSDIEVTAESAPTTPNPVTAVAPVEKPEAVLRLLPPGYGPGVCQPASSVPVGALAALECLPNADAGGPPKSTFTLFSDTGGLQRVFAQTVAQSEQQICPGRIQSPGPWRRNAAPELSAGTLFCGTRQDESVIAWTDEARKLLAVVESGPGGVPMKAMFDWWSTHS
jgi:serine/threonine-protein kinase